MQNKMNGDLEEIIRLLRVSGALPYGLTSRGGGAVSASPPPPPLPTQPPPSLSSATSSMIASAPTLGGCGGSGSGDGRVGAAGKTNVRFHIFLFIFFAILCGRSWKNYFVEKLCRICVVFKVIQGAKVLVNGGL